MASHNELGHKGEAIACDYLADKGYQILEKNWRFSRAEVDIIAKDGEILVFIEVKTRSNNTFAEPEEAITSKKEALMADAAAIYMEKIGHDWEIRFDIITVCLQPELKIKHYIDAFFPNWTEKLDN